MMGFNFDKKIKAMSRTNTRIPRILANEALLFFKDSFKNEAFSDKSVGSDPWAARKQKTKQDKATGRRRAILVQSGALRRSLRVVSARWNRIEVGSVGVKYAQYHNQGTDNHPKRQFVGKSKTLNRRLKAKLNREIRKIL
jgi:phage gpG-like protein